jgi:chitin disaccharide deacetylase
MAENERFLIVNADDFGLTPGVNAGVMRAREQGIVTSASLMVRWPATPRAAAYARDKPEFSLGLHVDLGEWAFARGEWVKVYEVVPFEDASAVESEIRHQLERFQELSRGAPTHLDSHQHVHAADPVAPIFRKIARELDVPLRDNTRQVGYCGSFYGQTDKGEPIPGVLTVEGLTEIIRAIPGGTTELSCHPAEGSDVRSTYRHEREMELKVLCDPRVAAVIESERITLCSFADLPDHAQYTGN